MPAEERILDPESSFTEEERQTLRDQLRRLQTEVGEGGGRHFVLEVEDGDPISIRLPDAVAEVVIGTLVDLVDGHAVSVADADEELTTREAAELLNVSRPHLVKLLKDGKIPSHKVGTHHRVLRRDVLKYKQEQRKRSEEAMQRLTEESQKLGLGY